MTAKSALTLPWLVVQGHGVGLSRTRPPCPYRIVFGARLTTSRSRCRDLEVIDGVRGRGDSAPMVEVLYYVLAVGLASPCLSSPQAHTGTTMTRQRRQRREVVLRTAADDERQEARLARRTGNCDHLG
jgi:hypothetical protein